jgi:hypothetical protein
MKSHLNLRVNLIWIGNIALVTGIALCLFAVGVRVLGYVTIFGYESLSFFIGGIALLVFSGLVKLETLIIGSKEKMFHPEWHEQERLTK